MDAARLIAEEIRNNPEGGTYSLEGDVSPVDGYWVGGAHPDGPLMIRGVAVGTDDLLEAAVRGFLRKAPTDWIGWWTDEGTLYVDATDWIGERRLAEEVGRKRRELAIYDISGKRDLRFVYVDGE